MKNLILLFIISTLTLAACSKGLPKDPDATKKVTVSGEAAKKFYANFYYGFNGSCEEGRWYNYIQSVEIPLQKFADGTYTVGTVNVYLEENGQFTADLKVQKMRKLAANHYYSETISNKRVQSEWQITDDGQIFLSGVGLGHAVLYHNEPAIDFYFAEDFVENQYKVKFVTTAKIKSTSGRDNECFPPNDLQSNNESPNRDQGSNP